MPQKISEEKLRRFAEKRFSENFFRLIAEYADRLDALQKEKEILKRQYDFISLLSHQLRTPVSAVKLMLELASPDIKDREMAEGINEKINNINSIINDLLFFLGGNASVGSEKNKFFSLSRLIEGELSSLKKKFEKKKISVKFKKPDFRAAARGDKAMIDRVIRLLLDNATAYNKPSGSVKISVSRAGKNFLKVSVKDTGFGIPEKEQASVFEKFFRASNASLGKNEGSGINLFVAREAVKSWGGKTGFKSKEGKGSTFYFTLPSANSGLN